MQKWKHSILAGNRCFEAENFTEAFTHYERCKELAKRLFHTWPNPDQATAALVVSYHNLAELYMKQNKTHRAFRELQQIHDFLSETLGNLPPETPAWIAVQRGLGKAHYALLAFIKQHRSRQCGNTLHLPEERLH